MHSRKFRINENLSWRNEVKQVFSLGDVGIEDFGLYLLSTWEHDFLLSLAEYLAKNKSFTLSKKQQETVLKIKFEILSTMAMIECNDDEIQQCPNPRQLPFAKQEVRRCHDAGMFWVME